MENIDTYVHGREIHTEELNLEGRHIEKSATQRKIYMEGTHTLEGMFI